jgi:hypothetical protein
MRSLYEVQQNTGHRKYEFPDSASSIQACISPKRDIYA